MELMKKKIREFFTQISFAKPFSFVSHSAMKILHCWKKIFHRIFFIFFTSGSLKRWSYYVFVAFFSSFSLQWWFSSKIHRRQKRNRISKISRFEPNEFVSVLKSRRERKKSNVQILFIPDIVCCFIFTMNIIPNSIVHRFGSSLIKQTHLFPMPFILSTLKLILLFFFSFL